MIFYYLIKDYVGTQFKRIVYRVVLSLDITSRNRFNKVLVSHVQ